MVLLAGLMVHVLRTTLWAWRCHVALRRAASRRTYGSRWPCLPIKKLPDGSCLMWCPWPDSNRHWKDFKSSISTDWITRAQRRRLWYLILSMKSMCIYKKSPFKEGALVSWFKQQLRFPYCLY